MRGNIPLDVVDNDDGKPVLPDESFDNAGQVRELCQLMIGRPESGLDAGAR
jgi:hypothetical protein